MGAPALSLAATLIDLADTLVSDFELVDYLDGLLARSLRLVEGDAGSVMLSDGDSDGDGAAWLQLLSSRGHADGASELFEVQCNDGPGIDCLAEARPVIVDDLSDTTRWPRYAAMAAAAGYRSAVAFPLRLRGEAVGVLSVLWRVPGAAALEDIHAVQALADMAAIGILHARERHEARELSGQLQSALRTRIIIEQAKGVLAEQAGLGMAAAFEALRRYSRNHSRRLREVANEVVAGQLSAPDIVGMAGRNGDAPSDPRVRPPRADDHPDHGAAVAAS